MLALTLVDVWTWDSILRLAPPAQDILELTSFSFHAPLGVVNRDTELICNTSALCIHRAPYTTALSQVASFQLPEH